MGTRNQAIFNPSNFVREFTEKSADTRYVRLVGGAPVLTRRVSTTQTINSGNDSIIQFNALDTYQNGVTGLTYNSGFFYNYSGRTRVFQVSYTVTYPQNLNGYRLAWIGVGSLNGQRRFATSDVDSNNQAESQCLGSATIVLAPNDFFAVYTWQSAGTGLDISLAGLGCSTGYSTKMQAVLLQ